MKLRIKLIRMLVAALCLSAAFSAGAADPAEMTRLAEAVRKFVPVTGHEKALFEANPRISPMLLQLAQQTKSLDDTAFSDKAASLGVPVAQRDVFVVSWPEEGAKSPDLERALADAGARQTIRLGNAVLGRIPVQAVEMLGNVKGLAYVAPQEIYEPMLDWSRLETASVASTKGAAVGILASGAERLHKAGIAGRGIKVGIIDFGFSRYSELARRSLVPAPVASRAFNAAGVIENDEVHGTGCAEIIHAMAPAAQLYLAAIDGSTDQIVLAARWLAERGVHVINFSGGGHGGPHNGTALLDKLVEEITARGILWVNAAGNEGASHWMGRTVDANRNGLIDIPGNANGDFLLVEIRGNFRLMVNWDDWGNGESAPAASQDIDAYLLAATSQGPQVVTRSENPQRGRGKPLEVLGGRVPAGTYALVLRATSVSRPVNVHVYPTGARIAPAESRGSVAIPATAPAALAVGAVHPDQARLATYSSRGPTDDGRVKPEVTAPAGTPSVAYDRHPGANGRFSGTSAASPHAAGYAALLKELHPQSDAGALRDIVRTHVRDIEPPMPNNLYGHGHIDASRVALKPDPPPAAPPPHPPTAEDAAVRERMRVLNPILELSK